MSDTDNTNKQSPRIVVRKNGSYHVYGQVPLVHKIQVVSEYGEPLTWKKENTHWDEQIEGKDHYSLCRCGGSSNKPFCDGSHRALAFDGTETADSQLTADREVILDTGHDFAVKYDAYLCMSSGFCANRWKGIEQMLEEASEPRVRAEIIAMIERCPSGAYSYAMGLDQQNIEPDLPVQIAITTEITSQGPIQGPLWVTGKIPIERSDGVPFEIRNRVTLCTCGRSGEKPLCDGTHREL